LLAGGSAGAFSIALVNPTEVVKTQMQSTKDHSLTMSGVVKKVVQTEGVLGLWAGTQPNVMRTFLVQAAEIGVYDHAKHLLTPHVGDGLSAYVGASFIAGIASAVTSTPADVVKTRFMNSAGAGGVRKGVIQTAMDIVKHEGGSALYKGVCVRVCACVVCKAQRTIVVIVSMCVCAHSLILSFYPLPCFTHVYSLNTIHIHTGFVPIVVRKVVWCSLFFVCYERTRAVINESEMF
jgi:hypothetical protein